MYPSDIRKLPDSQRLDAYKTLIVEEGWQDSLRLRIDAGVSLDVEELAELKSILGYRCRAATREAIACNLVRVPYLTSYGIYERILLRDRNWGLCVQYVAGQDYDSEIKTVRDCLKG